MNASCEIEKYQKQRFQYLIDFEEYKIKCQGKVVVDVRLQPFPTSKTVVSKVCTENAEKLCNKNGYKLFIDYDKFYIIDKNRIEIEFYYPISCVCVRNLIV